MKKLMILCTLPFFFAFKAGEEFDEKKMDRDLEISKKILATLIKADTEAFFGDDAIDASYIKGYGVIFSIPEHLVYFHSGGWTFSIPDVPTIPNIDIDLNIDSGYYGDFDLSEEDWDEQKAEMKKQKIVIRKNQQEMRKHQREVEKNRQEVEVNRKEVMRAQEEVQKATAGALQAYSMHNSHAEASKIDWEKIMITFMKDYADLIGQLEPNEKVVIRQNSPFNEQVFSYSAKTDDGDTVEEMIGNISAEVLRKDIAAYKTGKINESTFVSRIKIAKKESQKKIPDLEMFASIFDRFYSSDLTETFYCQGTPRYELLDGFGVVFYIKASSARSSYRMSHRKSGDNTWTISSDGEEAYDEKIFPKFKEDLKAFMLDYGRTIRSLKDDDIVRLEIEMNVCRNCDVPKVLEVSTKMAALKQYDQQKLDREKALSQIKIKEII